MIRTVIILQILLSCLAQETRTPRAPRPGVKDPGVRVAMTALKPEAIFEVPGAPDWIAIDESVWISNYPKDTVARLDPKTNKVLAMVPVGSKPCCGLAAGFGSLWVPLCGDQALVRVDLKEGKITATIPIGIGDSEGGLASGAGSIWLVTDKKGTLARIDPATNKVVAEIQVPAGSFAVAFGEGAIWVTGTETNVLTRINPDTNLVVESIPVGKAPRFLTIGGGFVWTLNQTTGDVSKVDPNTNKVVATIEVGVPGRGGEIAFGEGSLWVTSFEFPISRIDPALGKVVQQFAGEGGDAIRVGLGSVWLSNIRAGTVWRLDPRRIMATVPQ
jgi:virginiamycin B lyase